MKNFNLEEAMRGASVVTRSGKPVFQLTRFYKTESNFPIHGVVDQQIMTWTDKGKFQSDQDESIFDLMMGPVIHEGWIARYEKQGATSMGNPEYEVSDRIYDCLEAAQRFCSSAVGFHKITWEE